MSSDGKASVIILVLSFLRLSTQKECSSYSFITEGVIANLVNGHYDITTNAHNGKPVYSDTCGHLFIYFMAKTDPHYWVLGAVIGQDSGFAYKEAESLDAAAPWWFWDSDKEDWAVQHVDISCSETLCSQIRVSNSLLNEINADYISTGNKQQGSPLYKHSKEEIFIRKSDVSDFEGSTTLGWQFYDTQTVYMFSLYTSCGSIEMPREWIINKNSVVTIHNNVKITCLDEEKDVSLATNKPAYSTNPNQASSSQPVTDQWDIIENTTSSTNTTPTPQVTTDTTTVTSTEPTTQTTTKPTTMLPTTTSTTTEATTETTTDTTTPTSTTESITSTTTETTTSTTSETTTSTTTKTTTSTTTPTTTSTTTPTTTSTTTATTTSTTTPTTTSTTTKPSTSTTTSTTTLTTTSTTTQSTTPSTTTYNPKFHQFPYEDPECGIRQASSPSLFIVGANDVEYAGKWPWTVAIFDVLNNFICSGALISRDHIITAGHCFAGQKQESTHYVILGAHNLSNPNETFRQTTNISRFALHYNYSRITEGAFRVYHDIALAVLSPPSNITRYVRPACLPRYTPDVASNCYIAGYGQRGYTGAVGTLQHDQKTNIYDINKCATALSAEWMQNSSNVCAVPENHAKICKGDSGSPLMCKFGSSPNYSIVGLASWSLTICLLSDFPSIYVNVYDYLTWIFDVWLQG